MEKTEKLYYQDAFLWEFDALVLACTKEGTAFSVVLDRTAFYPEGGGQGADSGTLGGTDVTDVHEKDGVIYHTCAAELPVGAAVHGKIDGVRRFDHMQQHSGEHICSGMICAQFHCDNVGFHLGADTVTIDFNAEIAWEDLLALEQRANAYLYENHPAEIRIYRDKEWEGVPYRSKKALEGEVRIVSFPGADCCACCGTHVNTSAQVGIVKFLSCRRFRDGVRIELLCGARAYRYLGDIWAQNLCVAQSLSAKPTQSAAAVSKLLAENADLHARLAAAEERQCADLAEKYAGSGDVLLFCAEMSGNSVRRLCDAVAHTCGGRCAVFAGADTAWKYAIADPRDDLQSLVRSLNDALNGRGGGKAGFAQGSVSAARTEIVAFFRSFFP